MSLNSKAFHYAALTPPEGAEYDPYYGWEEKKLPQITNQKGDRLLSHKDYHHIASAVRNRFSDNLHAFCQREGLNVIQVSHEDFLKYERGTMDFRDWLEGVCADKGLNVNDADICIIGPCVKPLESVTRKLQDRIKGPEEVPDYLRTTLVALKKNPGSRRNRVCLSLLDRLIGAISVEEDGTPRARKDLLFKPHKDRAFRAYKVAWDTDLGPVDPLYQDEGIPQEIRNKMTMLMEQAGHVMSSEVQVKLESQMGIDRFSRQVLMALERSANRATLAFASGTAYSERELNRQINRMELWKKTVNKWGRLLYDRLAQDSGLNRFLAPELITERRALSAQEIIRQIKGDMRELRCSLFLRKQIRQALIETGVFAEENRALIGKLEPLHF